MANELERWIQAALGTPRQAVNQSATLLQSFLESLLVASIGAGYGFGSGPFGGSPFGGGTTSTSPLIDTLTIHANSNTQMVWDAAAISGGLWDDYQWDAAPAALTIGGFVWNAAGAIGQWDGGAVWQ